LKTSHKIALLVALALAIVAAYVYARRRSERAALPDGSDLSSNPGLSAPTLVEDAAPDPFAPVSSLVVDEAGIRVDWGTWMTFARKVLRQAVSLGFRNPHDILVHDIRAYPQLSWPPPADSPLSVDWQGLLCVLSSSFEPDPLPQSPPLLRIVR
jgi:hypothetical protein